MKRYLFLLLSFFALSLYAQQGSLTGTAIAASDKEPMIGLTVLVKGTTNGTVTDLDGNYTLTNVPKDAIIVFSMIGYKTQEVKVNGKNVINVVMEDDTQALDEVVVIGYGAVKKSDLTSSISAIKGDELKKLTGGNAMNALQGKINGVQITGGGGPGTSPRVIIRGVSTVNGSDPLYVVDGMPVGTNINFLDQNDIESMQVLKDASAAAIYGTRGSNGVVLITTKKGKKNDKVSINVNGYYGWQNLTRFPKLANAGQYVRGLAEAAQNRGEDPSKLYSPEELAKWEAGTEPGYKSYDYYDMVMRKNVPQYHINANVTGGSEKTNYYLSVAHTGQDAMMRDFKYERTNLQLNIDTKITDRFTIGAQISGKYEKTEDVGLPGGDGYYSAILSMFKMQPIESPYANDNPEYINNVHENGYNPAAFSRDIAGCKERESGGTGKCIG